MITAVASSKKTFCEFLNKGVIPPVDSIIHHQDVKPIIQNWYGNITKFDFLPEFESDLEEISILGPTEILFKINGHRTSYDSDLTWDDLEILMEFLTLKNKITWNPLVPFASFFTKLRGRKVRITLIHGSTNQANHPKMYIRILNETIIPLPQIQSLDWIEMVRSKKNILISGATGSGKTTLLNSLLSEISIEEHVAVIEDTYELIYNQPGVTRFLTDLDKPNHGMLDYLKYAMRISPDRIIVGELRSKEVEALIMAINSGHNGVMSSIHANDARSALEKCALLFQLYSSEGLSYELVLKLITQNIDYVVHLENKRVVEVIQVYGSENSQLFFEKIY